MKFLVGIILAAVQLQPFPAVAAQAAAAAAAAAVAPIAPVAPVAPTPPIVCSCTFDYKPVCGTDGITYSNECVLRCVSAENVRNGRPRIDVYRQGQCPQPTCYCPAVYQPVCGTDGQTYPNKCALGCENQRREKLGLPEIKVFAAGRCPPPTCRCIKEAIIPVCGTDNVTYRNICFLQCASRLNQHNGLPAIFFKNSGPCKEEACPCKLDYNPICASDGKTYRNKCLLECENRRRDALGQYPLTIKYDGPCCNCLLKNDPVCASDERTYRTPCHLKCENDARATFGLPKLTVVSKGVCPCICKKFFDPVCGTDNRDYANICLLHCASVKREYEGKGRIRLAYGGPCACDCSGCNPQYAPVCGSDGRSFWNRCWLDCYSNCNTKRQAPEIKLVNLGYCKNILHPCQ